ncbi:MAG: four helix bundle protein [Candidatus Omnitrophica bacterium]|nr:four helix bundle protein [Candidatus Omnitrophota bacterium]
MFSFEKLEVWQESLKLVLEINKLTKIFPKEEMFALSSQMKRAVLSISLNIAEGSGRSTKLDFKRFVQIAIGSTNETVTCLFVAKNQKYIDEIIFSQFYLKLESISKMLYSMEKYLKVN